MPTVLCYLTSLLLSAFGKNIQASTFFPPTVSYKYLFSAAKYKGLKLTQCLISTMLLHTQTTFLQEFDENLFFLKH